MTSLLIQLYQLYQLYNFKTSLPTLPLAILQPMEKSTTSFDFTIRENARVRVYSDACFPDTGKHGSE